METQSVYARDLDQFESEVLALLTDLRVDERQHADLAARQEAYESTVKRHGFA
jgi:demethoxyubiquinone hydroxylase (CLK1/Coq7/Cat5 family)